MVLFFAGDGRPPCPAHHGTPRRERPPVALGDVVTDSGHCQHVGVHGAVALQGGELRHDVLLGVEGGGVVAVVEVLVLSVLAVFVTVTKKVRVETDTWAREGWGHGDSA